MNAKFAERETWSDLKVRSYNYYDTLYDTAGKPHFMGHIPGLVLWKQLFPRKRTCAITCSVERLNSKATW